MDDRSPISIVAERTGFTRSHVRNHAHRNRKRLGITKVRDRWVLSRAQMRALERIVILESGMRYKLGETGPRRQ